MRRKRLARAFFNRETLTVAKELLGKFLVRKIGRKITAAMITETEAYCGPNDLASHASRGRTPRTEIMFGPPGHAYIYLIYGIHHCFNIVTERKGYPAAVLIRSMVLPLTTFDAVRGPGKICRLLKIDRVLNNENIAKSNKLWLENRGIKVRLIQIKCAPRIGIDYAGQYKHKLWRFILE